MALTEAQKGLVSCLKNCGISKGKAMVVCLLLKEECLQLDMMEYLLSRDKVSDEEALNMAHKLAEQK